MMVLGLLLAGGQAGAAETNAASVPLLDLLEQSTVATLWDNYLAVLKEAGSRAPVLADEPLTIQLNQSPDYSAEPARYPGWAPTVRGRLFGHTRPGDAVIIEFAKGGTVMRSDRIGLSGNNPGEGQCYESFELPLNEEKLITSDGEFTVTFKYYDDTAETTRVLAVRKVTVVRAAQHESSGRHLWKFAMLYDFLPAQSVVLLALDEQYAIPRMWWFAWARRADENLNNFSCKILVDSVPLALPQGFDVLQGTVDGVAQQEDLYFMPQGNAVENKYNWVRYRFAPYIYWGPKRTEGVADNFIAMADHPGNWVVKLRENGETLRELRFRVTPGGLLVPHPEQDQAQPGALQLGPLRYFVETGYGAQAKFDDSFKPDALKAGAYYGRPWLSDAVKTGMLSTLPPAVAGARPFPSPRLPNTR